MSSNETSGPPRRESVLAHTFMRSRSWRSKFPGAILCAALCFRRRVDGILRLWLLPTPSFPTWICWIKMD